MTARSLSRRRGLGQQKYNLLPAQFGPASLDCASAHLQDLALGLQIFLSPAIDILTCDAIA